MSDLGGHAAIIQPEENGVRVALYLYGPLFTTIYRDGIFTDYATDKNGKVLDRRRVKREIRKKATHR